MRSVLQRTGTGGGFPDEYSTQGLTKVLRSTGGLHRLYAAFAAANTQPLLSYEEGAAFPGVAPPEVAIPRPDSPRAGFSTKLNHLTAKTATFRPDALQRRGVTLSANGAASTTVAFSTRRVRSVSATLANASTRYRCSSSTGFACEGRPLDQQQRLAVKVEAFRR